MLNAYILWHMGLSGIATIVGFNVQYFRTYSEEKKTLRDFHLV